MLWFNFFAAHLLVLLLLDGLIPVFAVVVVVSVVDASYFVRALIEEEQFAFWHYMTTKHCE